MRWWFFIPPDFRLGPSPSPVWQKAPPLHWLGRPRAWGRKLSHYFRSVFSWRSLFLPLIPTSLSTLSFVGCQGIRHLNTKLAVPCRSPSPPPFFLSSLVTRFSSLFSRQDSPFRRSGAEFSFGSCAAERFFVSVHCPKGRNEGLPRTSRGCMIYPSFALLAEPSSTDPSNLGSRDWAFAPFVFSIRNFSKVFSPVQEFKSRN